MRTERPDKKANEQRFDIPESLVIHNVYIADRSGSMQGAKYAAMIAGLKEDVEAIKQQVKDNPNVKYTISLVDFATDIETRAWLTLAENYNVIVSNPVGGTSLYQAVGTTIERILQNKNLTDKVLIKIFTDGGENTSKGKYSSLYEGMAGPCLALDALIADVQKQGFTVTFVGTQEDTRNMINNFHLDVSNTLIHNNTASDIKKKFGLMKMSSINYTKKALRGESVTLGFFKDTN